MSYLEDLTARRDYTQALAFFISRRFMHHAQIDPLTFDFSLPHSKAEDRSLLDRLPKNATEDIVATALEAMESARNERDRVYFVTPLVHGFTAADLTIVQYGRITAILERGLNSSQQIRWQALESKLIVPWIILEYASAKMGQGNYSAGEIEEVVRRFNNQFIIDNLDDVDVISRTIEQVCKASREEGELAPKRSIRPERASNPLKSLYEALPSASEHGQEIPELARRIDDYIVTKLLPSPEKIL